MVLAGLSERIRSDMTTPKKTRLTVDLTPELSRRLENITRLTGAASKADAVRDALRVLEYLVEKNQKGYELLQRKGDAVETVPIFRVL